MLPAWLGWEAALSKALERGEGDLLGQMREQWPFFRTRIDMLEMVLAKMAYRTLTLKGEAEAVSQALLDRHYFRKHGAAATYGQTTDAV